jgi:Family of unknown function (DUF5906)
MRVLIANGAIFEMARAVAARGDLRRHLPADHACRKTIGGDIILATLTSQQPTQAQIERLVDTYRIAEASAALTIFAGCVAVTPMHGCKSPQQTDWAPICGRRVVIWPDHDTPGARFAQRVAELATAAGAESVAIVEVPESFPEGWDLADPLPDGWNAEQIHDLFAGAAPWAPTPEAPQPNGKDADAAPEGDALSKVISEFNAKYAVVIETGKVLVFKRADDPQMQNRKLLTRIPFPDFKRLYQNRKITVTTQNGSTTKSAAEWWLDSSRRRQYEDGVVFDPTGKAPPTFWNLWDGFAVEPRPGDWSLMQDHIHRVICCGNDEHTKYLLDWTAQMFQKPQRQGAVAVVVRGEKGAGKGILFHYMRRALGQHGFHISNAKYLVGNFNAHLRDCVFLFADEAFFAGDRQHESVLKALVTEPVIAIEAKGRDLVLVPNMLHIGMASNSAWVVPASHDERRYYVLNAADNRLGQTDYFDAILDQMDNKGGLAAMIWDMLHRDISKFDVRKVPQTPALSEQKQHSLDTLDRWWLTVLERGFVFRSRHGLTAFRTWNEFYTTELLSRSYLQWCADNRVSRPMTRVELGKRMTKMYQKHRPVGDELTGEVESATHGFLEHSLLIKQSNATGYRVDTLDQARARFSDISGIPGEWKDDPP